MSDEERPNGSISGDDHDEEESGEDLANGKKRGGDSNDSPVNKKKRESKIEESVLAENNRRLTTMTGDSLFVQFPEPKKEQIAKLGGTLNIWSTKQHKETSVCTGRVTFDSEKAADSVIEKLSTFGLDDDVKVRKDNRESSKQNLNLRRLRIEKIPVSATILDVAKIVPEAIEIRVRAKNLKGSPLEFKDAAVVFDNEEDGKKAFLELADPEVGGSKVFVVLDPARQWRNGRGFFPRGRGGGNPPRNRPSFESRGRDGRDGGGRGHGGRGRGGRGPFRSFRGGSNS